MSALNIKALTVAIIMLLSSSMTLSVAQAQPLLFTFTGTDNAAFILDSNPAPTSYSDYSFMEGDGVLNGTLDGVPHNFEEITFYSEAGGGGISARDGSLCCTAIGPVVFSGSTKNPVFSAGTTYNFSGLDTLTISAVSSAPEPSVWTLMIVGLGLAGLVLRRQRVGARATSGAVRRP